MSSFRVRPSHLALLRNIAILAAIVFVAGLFMAPRLAWAGYLIAFVYFTGLGVAAVLAVAILYIANAHWQMPMRRVPEAMATTLPVAGALGIVLLCGISPLYEWSHTALVQDDAVLVSKTGWLNGLFFAGRLVVYFAVWIWFARAIAARAGHRRRAQVISAVFMAVAAVTWSLASFDWLMSLEPHWFSTMFGLYQMGGTMLTLLATATILVVVLRRQGTLRDVVTDDHLQILGRLMLSLSLFWAYVWYCQYMLIWYAHIPEEVAYYAARKGMPWSVLGPTNLVVNWLIPFVVLMPRRACRNESILVRVASVIMIGHLLDLVLQVGPSRLTAGQTPGLWLVAPSIGAVALFFRITLGSLSRVATPHEAHA